MDKAEYFHRLYSLMDPSDDEEDTNDVGQVLRQIQRPGYPSSSSFQPVANRRRTQVQKKVPAIQRATSAPVSSEVKETPTLPRKTSLLQYDLSTPESSTSIPLIETFTAEQMPKLRPDPERSTSTPNIGSVVMTNSMGIESMLKKKKRKRSSLTLVPENERIFAGHTFFWIPPDDVAPLRRTRITKSISYGVTWTKEWVSSITHVVVDNDIEYKDVIAFLKSTLKVDTLSPEIILVNADYPLDCIQFRALLDPQQRRYAVKDLETSFQDQRPPISAGSQKSDSSLQIKPSKQGNSDKPPQITTPLQNPLSPQASRLDQDSDMSQGVWLHSGEAEGARLVESPHHGTPVESERTWEQGDALDEMIMVAKNMEHLPLSDDEEEEEGSSNDPGDEGGSDGESPLRAPKKQRKSSKKRSSFNQDGFSCMEGGTGVALHSNPNKRSIEILQEMCDIYVRTQDQWRSRAYRRAIGVLKKQTKKISFYEEAKAFDGIGHRLAEKIQEIVLKDSLQRLEYAKMEPTDQILSIFLKIYGVGLSKAWEWIQAGYKTLDDLKAHAHLTDNQRIGIEHYHDFLTRIPRDEVTALGDIVKAAVADIDPQVDAIIGGSYRRGAATSGDIDFMLTKPGTSSSHDLLPFLIQLLDKLTREGFLVAALAKPGSVKGSGSKWHGAALLPGTTIWRRIDLLLVPETEWGAALIYFTGDDIFNRSIRLLSSRKGMRLNQRGLYKDVMRGPGRVKLNEGTLVEGADEKKIFAVLGVPWRLPEQRICN